MALTASYAVGSSAVSPCASSYMRRYSTSAAGIGPGAVPRVRLAAQRHEHNSSGLKSSRA